MRKHNPLAPFVKGEWQSTDGVRGQVAAFVVWLVAVSVAVGLMGYGWAIGAEESYSGWLLPTTPANYDQGRIRSIHEVLAREIRRAQEEQDSTTEKVSYGWVKLTAGVAGVKLPRSYGNDGGYMAIAFEQGQTYLQGGLWLTHRVGIRPVDADSIVVQAYDYTGIIATDDTSTVGWLVWKMDR